MYATKLRDLCDRFGYRWRVGRYSTGPSVTGLGAVAGAH
jgi:hypothetical protein